MELFLAVIIVFLLVMHKMVVKKHDKETKNLIEELKFEKRGHIKHKNLSTNFAAIISSHGSEEMKKMMNEIYNNFSN